MPEAAAELARRGLSGKIIVALRRIGKRKTFGDEEAAEIGAGRVVAHRRRHRRALARRHAADDVAAGGAAHRPPGLPPPTHTPIHPSPQNKSNPLISFDKKSY